MRVETDTSSLRRSLTLIALIAAGEAAFFLPFLLARIFRPTLLEVFGLTNLELGTAFAVYGGVAMAAYFFGGPLADRFRARTMLFVALSSTASGGLVFATGPSISTLILLYGYWGITTIALFWAPLIRATREWGGEFAQGAAFGLLDGGRGLLAAATASSMVLVFASLLPVDPTTATLEQRTDAFRQIILLVTAITFGCACLLWVLLPQQRDAQHAGNPKLNLRAIARVFRLPAVWLQSFIIMCAYVGFKATDDFSLYANEVIGLNEVDAASAGTLSLWIRPVAAVIAGFLADRFSAGRMTLLSFLFLALGSIGLASGIADNGTLWFFLATMICASLGIFALRGLYFAIMQEGRIPLAVTGSAVGFVSLIGYTPDVFMGPLMGYLLDQSPGAAGHQQVFWVVTLFSLAGLIASACFVHMTRAAATVNPSAG
ncbi:MAG: MFS transporter [Gammaproteobacteria bacterium]